MSDVRGNLFGLSFVNKLFAADFEVFQTCNQLRLVKIDLAVDWVWQPQVTYFLNNGYHEYVLKQDIKPSLGDHFLQSYLLNIFDLIETLSHLVKGLVIVQKIQLINLLHIKQRPFFPGHIILI